MTYEMDSYTARRRLRRSFGNSKEIGELPNLLALQKGSYEKFLQSRKEQALSPMKRVGIEDAFNSIFPIKDTANRAEIHYVSYWLEEAKYDVDECIQRGITYAAPLRVKLSLITKTQDEDTGATRIETIKEQDVYMGDMPLMTERGTFIVNGAERVIVSQTHRSPGVFFDKDTSRASASVTKSTFSARVIPYRGSWLDFEFGARDVLYFRIDRKRKLPVTTLLMALDSLATVAARRASHDKGEELEPSYTHGMGPAEILREFYKLYKVERKDDHWLVKGDTPRLRILEHSPCDIFDSEQPDKQLASEQTAISRETRALLRGGTLDAVLTTDSFVLGQYLGRDYIDDRGIVLAHAGDEVTEEMLVLLRDSSISTLELLDIEGQSTGPYVRNALLHDRNRGREEALADIYRVIRPGEPPTQESAVQLFKQLFFSNERYDLSDVGRVKMNERLRREDLEEITPENRVLNKGDILDIIKELITIRDGRGNVDDIDHLGNRRIRSVGELLENLYRSGLMRMERTIRERMTAMDLSKVMPQDLINSKPVVTIVKEFFGSSQLSQFMDQTNPLAEVTHKRRLSALGPGGLSRDRAGFEVRDVHTTHYGRICPIETPEGPNVGLINSLATYARVNRYGFLETPYRRVVDGVVTDDILFLTATREESYSIAQANSQIDDKTRKLSEERVSCRRNGELQLLSPGEVDFMDVSPKQIVSVAASLIPFLENDDANRALMGSNMQRQAVPLLCAEAPLVGTGMERRVALDSGVTALARRDGIVDQVDATRVVVRVHEEKDDDKSRVDIYNLLKFQRTNQNTCILQRPLPNVGDRVAAGDVIADGSSTDLGELALGRNVLVAFMSWNGYNFEDSIVISERLVQDDVFTSIHIEEYECVARDTKLGQEDITRDIPNVSEENLRTLDESGIVYVGAEVKAGEILVGKVTPKGESPVTPEEKLLRAIFGEKATDVRDSSLYVPQGGNGTIVEVRVFTRQGVDKDERAVSIGRSEVERLAKDREAERRILESSFRDRLVPKLLNHKVVRANGYVADGTTLGQSDLADLSASKLRQIVVEHDELNQEIDDMNRALDKQLLEINNRFEDRVEKLRRGDELLPGVLKIVKVFVAVKRKLQCGDKMAGRHGNKGVVSRIVPVADMPFLEDGTPVDIILNPLGVPSRMNVGQILETHLGWACRELGREVGVLIDSFQGSAPDMTAVREKLQDTFEFKATDGVLEALSDSEVLDLAKNIRGGLPIATPVFDGANEATINRMLTKAGLPSSGQAVLIDGLTGEFFDRPVTVGYIYMLKLHHLVEDKLHARSTGPYSLVTQQPLGGKAQFGGQRFGEMEVWALQAYGASYTLQEILTVKSDDITGRAKIYESIILNEDSFEAGIPESFNVLIKELRSLCLNVELLRGKAT